MGTGAVKEKERNVMLVDIQMRDLGASKMWVRQDQNASETLALCLGMEWNGDDDGW